MGDCSLKLSFCTEKVNYESFPIECHPYDYKNKNNGREHQNYPHLLRITGSQIFFCFVILFNFIQNNEILSRNICEFMCVM